MPNPWDIGTARLLEHAGFKALASTSAGLAFSLGRRDGDGVVTADETFDHVRKLVEATTVPVSADLENGFGSSPESVRATIRRAGEVGLAGASIEDASYDADNPIYDFTLAVERIQAAVEASRALKRPFVLTARSENFLRGRPNFDDTLRRLEAFEKAGADVLFAPGLPDENSLRVVCKSFKLPFNYVIGCGPTRFTLSQLKEIGVKRVSVGGSLARVAFTKVLAAATEMQSHGTFSFLEGLPSVAQVGELVAKR
jgi:2-methylisocitrate lyase-like PEP mutase family enzyme